MDVISMNSVGEVWVELLKKVLSDGTFNADDSTQEVFACSVRFTSANPMEEVLMQCGKSENITEMRKVFFGTGPNAFGHSYQKLIRGPYGFSDLSDVGDLLRTRPHTKRAVIQWVSDGNGKVPCVSTMHFLIREEALKVTYFARGQDVYNKFYADAVCLHELASKVSHSVDLPLGEMIGVINSAHIYQKDLSAAEKIVQKFHEEDYS